MKKLKELELIAKSSTASEAELFDDETDEGKAKSAQMDGLVWADANLRECRRAEDAAQHRIPPMTFIYPAL